MFVKQLVKLRQVSVLHIYSETLLNWRERYNRRDGSLFPGFFAHRKRFSFPEPAVSQNIGLHWCHLGQGRDNVRSKGMVEKEEEGTEAVKGIKAGRETRKFA